MNKKKINFHERSYHPYYIMAPSFRQSSAGIRAMHYLCHALNEMGMEAYVVTPNDGRVSHLRTPMLTTEIQQQHAQCGLIPIAIYPEVASGNPLNCHVVARWILNIPGLLGGDTKFAEDEILFCWEEFYLPEGMIAEKLQVPIIDRRIFYSENNKSNRHGYCFYANKYFKHTSSIPNHISENGISLCLSIPRSHDEIAEILRACEILYCYEPTNLAREALACGCAVAYVDTEYLNDCNLKNISVLKVSESQIGKFHPDPVDSRIVAELFDNLETEAGRQISNLIEATQSRARKQKQIEISSEYRLQKAISDFQNADYYAAFNKLITLAEELHNNPLPYAYLAFISAALNMPDDAATFIDLACNISPNRSDIVAALGESFLKAGNAPYAVHYLNAAISAQPDLFHAYPALAEGLRQTGQSEAAIALLRSAAGMPSSAQTNIRTQLLEALANQGNLEAFGKSCLAFATGPAEYSLAIRMLARSDNDPAQMLSTIDFLRDNLPVASPDETPGNPSVSGPARAQTTIAFLVSNFQREGSLGRLEALLANLPPETFFTLVIDNDPQAENHESAQRCALLVDRWLAINQQSDDEVLSRLAEFAPDILIDLDGYSAAQRLTLFSMAEVPCKLSWSDLPLPPLAQTCSLLAGKALLPSEKMTDTTRLATLPGLGEVYQLPAISPEQKPLPQVPLTTFGCLTPAIQVSQDSWQLFAQLLAMTPDANLTINLAELGDSAAEYIQAIFTGSGIAADRLNFIHACDEAALCRHWLNIRIGLAPLHGTGDLALPTCLWMNRPYVALNSEHLWSRRPAALLESMGHSEWAPSDRDGYLAVAQQLATRSDETPALRQQMQAAGLCDAKAFTLGFIQTLHATCGQGMQ